MILYSIAMIGVYLVSLVAAPLLLLPIVVLPAGITDALTSAGNSIAMFNVFVPIGTLISVFGIMVGVEVGYFAYKGIKWIYNKIPGIT